MSREEEALVKRQVWEWSANVRLGRLKRDISIPGTGLCTEPLVLPSWVKLADGRFRLPISKLWVAD